MSSVKLLTDHEQIEVHSHGAECAQNEGQLVSHHDALGRVDLADLPSSCRLMHQKASMDVPLSCGNDMSQSLGT